MFDMGKMKKLSVLICLLFLLMMAGKLTAQVVDVCAGDGTDSVTLVAANYQYGNIQWQYSEDMLTWYDIPRANDTVYRFLPDRECYCRAWIQYSNCQPDSSQVSHILFPPTAYAGPDRILNVGYVTHLFGNEVDNARCMWHVIEGDTPELEDPTFHYSQFSGSDTLYKLTWTVANACGVSTDTVEIRYVESRFYDAIAVVDTTDIILSDSVELANGVYRIVFSNPVPNITDTTILVGIPNGGFLRRVVYFEHHGDTCEMYTAQATLDDILEEGVIYFDAYDAELSTETRGGGSYIRLNHLPTRAEIMTDPIYRSGKICYYDFHEEEERGALRRSRVSHELVYELPAGNSIVGLTGGLSIRNFHFHSPYNLRPYFEVSKTQWWKAPFEFGVENKLGLDFDIRAENAITIHGKKFDFGEKATRFLVMAGFIPVEGKIAIKIIGNLDAELSLNRSVDLNVSADLKGRVGLVVVEDGRDTITGPYFETEFNVEMSDEEVSLTGDVMLEIGPRFEIKLYEVLGPYVELLGHTDVDACVPNPLLQTESMFLTWAKPYFLINLGVDLSIFKKNLFDIHERIAFDDGIVWMRPKTVLFPNKMIRLSDVDHAFTYGSWLNEAIQVKVFGFGNRPKKNVKVLFRSPDGIVADNPYGTGSSEAYAYTDTRGIAQMYWKPENQQNSKLSVILQDCEGNHINGSPKYFFAHAENGSGNVCLNSTLSLDVVDGQLRSFGGDGAHQYSADGIIWSSNKPFPLEVGHTYYVRDENNCEASATWTVQEAITPCALTINTYINGLKVKVKVNHGTAPYHYFVDGVDISPNGTTNIGIQQVFTQSGEYTITVTDANGCTVSKEVQVSDGQTKPTVHTIDFSSLDAFYTVGGVIVDDGNAIIRSCGVQWSLSEDMSDFTTISGAYDNNGLGAFRFRIDDILPGTTYYVRAYATNCKGTGYGAVDTITVPGSTPSGGTSSCAVASIRSNETGSDGVITSVRDHENNSYAVVQIGSQCWLKENMRCTTSPSTGANMVENPANADNMSATERRAYYDQNDPANAANGYGLFYNWPAAMDGSTTEGARGICPEGWHLPTDAEWTTLLNTAVSIHQPEVTPSLAFGTTNSCEGTNTSIAQILSDSNHATWNTYFSNIEVAYQAGQITLAQYNTYMNIFSSPLGDASGFSAVPANMYEGSFYTNSYGHVFVAFWTSTDQENDMSYCRAWYGESCFFGVWRSGIPQTGGYPVRCLRNEDGGDTPTTTGDGQPCPGTPTVTDVDGNIYNTVLVGEQCWMKENLRTTHYSDGTEIPAGTETSTTTGYRYAPNNDVGNVADYGYLYNWTAVMHGASSSDANPSGVQGICPTGWHVPSDAEWTQLTDYVSSQSQYICDNNSNYIAKALAATEGWITIAHSCVVGNGQEANNATGFSARPAGHYYGGYDYFGYYANFWCATEIGSGSAYHRYLYCDDPDVSRSYYKYYERFGLSVRCLKNGGGSNAAILPSVSTSVEMVTNSSAYCGGYIDSDGGAAIIAKGICWSTTQNPTIFDNHTSDESGMGDFISHLSNLSANTTYYVRAYAINFKGVSYGNELTFTTLADVPDGQPCPGTPTLTDVDNNSYNTVKIGAQCWMKENLRTTHYTDGTFIPDGGSTYSDDVPYRYLRDADLPNLATFGYLYNWPAVMYGSNTSSTNPSGVQGICPNGWHVPSYAEWTQLIDYVGGQTQFVCGNDNANIAKALSSSTYWWNDSNDCTPGNDLTSNNTTGFSAHPIGAYSLGNFGAFGYYSVFWSATHYDCCNDAWHVRLEFNYTSIYQPTSYTSDGLSVRCLRD